MTLPPQPTIDPAVRQGIKWGFIGYIALYAFPFFIGLLCTGAMLLVGYILATVR